MTLNPEYFTLNPNEPSIPVIPTFTDEIITNPNDNKFFTIIHNDEIYRVYIKILNRGEYNQDVHDRIILHKDKKYMLYMDKMDINETDKNEILKKLDWWDKIKTQIQSQIQINQSQLNSERRLSKYTIPSNPDMSTTQKNQLQNQIEQAKQTRMMDQKEIKQNINYKTLSKNKNIKSYEDLSNIISEYKTYMALQNNLSDKLKKLYINDTNITSKELSTYNSNINNNMIELLIIIWKGSIKGNTKFPDILTQIRNKLIIPHNGSTVSLVYNKLIKEVTIPTINNFTSINTKDNKYKSIIEDILFKKSNVTGANIKKPISKLELILKLIQLNSSEYVKTPVNGESAYEMMDKYITSMKENNNIINKLKVNYPGSINVNVKTGTYKLSAKRGGKSKKHIKHYKQRKPKTRKQHKQYKQYKQ